jgi:arylsulfatase
MDSPLDRFVTYSFTRLPWYFDWFKFQFWRFVFVQQVMAKEIQTFLDYPPMQRGASFNLDALKAEMAKRMAEAEQAAKGPGN